MNKQLTRLLGLNDPANWLADAVDEWLVRADAARPVREPGWFHPSSLGSECDAFLAFDYLGLPRQGNVNAENLRVLDHGVDRDLAWKRYLRGAGLARRAEDKRDCDRCGKANVDYRHVCIPELRLRGECDEIVEHPVTGEEYIAEIKTKRQELFQRLSAPDHPHVLQVHAYMAALGIKNAFIVYENSNTKAVKVFPVQFDVTIWRGVTERLERIRAQLESGVEPERTPSQWETSCPFYRICSTTHLAAEAKRHALR